MKKPWDDIPGWDIVGMNHYRVNGERRIFIALTNKDGLCIKEEGKDDDFIWNRLWHKANMVPCGKP